MPKERADRKMYHRIGIMIGSPSDADEERQKITDAILRWNSVHGEEKGVIVEAVRWETHATPGLKDRPQAMINEELIPKSDALVAVFRARAGSPTGRELSGTIEEIREFMLQGKDVVVYFYGGEVALRTLDAQQLMILEEFKKDVAKEGLLGSYQNVDELAGHVTHFVSAIVSRFLQRQGNRRTSDPGAAIGTSSLNPKPGTATRINERAAARKPLAPTSVVGDSGRLALLHTHFAEARSVRRIASGDWLLEIETSSAAEDAAINELRPPKYGTARPIAFAYRNDAFLVRVASIESLSEGAGQLWTVALRPEEMDYGGGIFDMSYNSGTKRYSPEDFARMRAGRLLLNDPAPLNENHRRVGTGDMSGLMIESFIQGTNTPVLADKCVIQYAYKQFKGDDRFLLMARLLALFFVRTTGVAETILELTLGPLAKGKVHVRFNGRRAKIASNAEPAVIEVEGDCPLS